ncbi:LysM domain-containing protein [Hydrogenispora ethanolica]|uniref:LysM domain-containing protein n=1 Tax=Hydrogenispora ethanolica TaxID=1082276 RepID=A0A4R1RWJ7_HYDET|nr:LysM peptidoglycan-binding domain-containing protein [Hydrogenispora ethanolica]TCL70976.1 LysM domain-containing protein [Hydrogenispora ethanolica]
MARQCPPGTTAYTIKAGDTFYRLAQEYKTTVAAISAANPNVNPNALQVGQVICIPREPTHPACPEKNYYTVKSGDTLYKIARTFKLSVDDLEEANPSIDPNRLRVGQVICIPLAVPPAVCPEGTSAYTIKAGDTFYNLAVRFNTTADAIASANPGLNSEALLIGQTICIPGNTAPAPAPDQTEKSATANPEVNTCPTGTFSYTVKAGDTFYSLAQRYRTTTDAIIRANPGINPNSLQLGQTICIPGPLSTPTPPVTACPSGSTSHTIQAGDTLYALAQAYDTTVQAITSANSGLDPNNLQVGRKICIPGTPPPVTPAAACPSGSTTYTLRAGDLLYNLAQRYNTTVEAIINANPGLNPNLLRVGQRICIPPTPSVPAPPTGPCPGASYTIQAGDTVYALAQEYNTTIAEILAANPGLDPDRLRIGQRICLPGTAAGGTLREETAPETFHGDFAEAISCTIGTFAYTIRSGDTLYLLAQKYRTTVDAILRANPGINPNALQIGQSLCIPGSAPTSCPTGTSAYIVQSGDTLYSLAQAHQTSVDAIVQANPDLDPNRLQIGQSICIPGTAQPQPPAACPDGSSAYNVQPGDTLYALAQRFNTSVNAILRVNPGLDANALQIGQSICVPGQILRPCADGDERYTIQAGDTLNTIARRFNTTFEAILLENPGLQPDRLRIGEQICIPKRRLIYTNRQFGVVLLYPAGWQRVSDERYEGSSGFFQVSAAGSGITSLEEMCRNEAFQNLKPYGSNPTVNRTTVDGQEACSILPSSDQPAEMKQQAAVIVRYPRPVEISGQTYNFFVLWADRNHLNGLAATLEFLSS